MAGNNAECTACPFVDISFQTLIAQRTDICVSAAHRVNTAGNHDISVLLRALRSTATAGTGHTAI